MPSPSSDIDLTVEQHLGGANDNLAFAERLAASGASDCTTIGWAITALFYSALHCVRAYLLYKHGERVSAHADMREYWTRFPDMRMAKNEYDELKQQSQSARYYLCQLFTWDDYRYLKKATGKVLAILKPRIKVASAPGSPPTAGPK